MSDEDRSYMGSLMLKAMSSNMKLSELIPKPLRLKPDGLEIVHTILMLFAKKDADYITQIRECKGRVSGRITMYFPF